MRRKKTALAASFIVTAGVVAGCGSSFRTSNPPEPIHRNPPAPQPTVVVEPEDTADPKWTDPPPQPESTPPESTPPDAPPGVTVMRRNDGTCFYYGEMPKIECPPQPATCNPPPPVIHDAKCPPEQK
jgi:hypothetical protein